MRNAFNMEPRPQQEWSWLLATWLFLGGTGSGLFLLYLTFELHPYYGALSWGLVIVGGGVLLLELGNPLRAWRTVFRPDKSWLSRGVFFVVGFMISSALSIGLKLAIFPWLSSLNNGPVAELLGWVAGFCALMIIVYPAFFFLSTSRAIPFWNTPLLPLLFAGYAILGGAGLILALTPLFGGPPGIEPLTITLILINAVMISIYLVTMSHSGGSAKESVRLLNRAPLSLVFWIGVIVVGFLLPLLGFLILPSSAAVAGVLILLGALLFRNCLLKAGVYIPPALVASQFDLSTLNGTNSEFRQEYAGMQMSANRRAA